MKKTLALVFALVVLTTCAFAQEKPFLGKWDIMGDAPNQNVVYWLEVKKETDGNLSGKFLNRGGSVLPLHAIKLEGDELVLTVNKQPNSPVHRVKVVGKELKGSVKTNNNTINWTGVRPPKWGKYNANGKHKFGEPVALFDGKSMEAFDAQIKTKPFGWNLVEGVMTNDVHGNNLVSKQKFQNFKINCEYKLEPKQPGGNAANGGIYLRGRYELQVLDDETATTDRLHSHMAVYSRVAPLVQASKKAGEWQEMEAIIVGNRVSVKLNGQVVHDNTLIEGITGGALDSREGDPGPIMIQGDHEKVYFRKIIVTPIVK